MVNNLNSEELLIKATNLLNRINSTKRLLLRKDVQRRTKTLEKILTSLVHQLSQADDDLTTERHPIYRLSQLEMIGALELEWEILCNVDDIDSRIESYLEQPND